MSDKLDEIASRATEELHTPGKYKRKPDGATFRTIRSALTEAYDLGRAERDKELHQQISDAAGRKAEELIAAFLVRDKGEK